MCKDCKESIMKNSNLNNEEIETLNEIIHDLRIIFEKDKIKPSELEDLKEDLKSDQIIHYLEDLRGGSLPESALKDKLMSGESILTKFFFGRTSPEVSIEEGYIDYKIESWQPILLEVKPLFTVDKSPDNEIRALRNRNLDWHDHEDQIEKYRRDYDYLIFTNLKEWYFFTRKEPEPIHEGSVNFDEFYKNFKESTGLEDYLDRLKSSHTRADLDEVFFDSLEQWVTLLKSIDFKEEISEREKISKIIEVINKFIFVQTLDDYKVIDFEWIRINWEEKERKWNHKGPDKVVKEFFREVDNWFFDHYDTELFAMNIFENIKNDKENLDEFCRRIKWVLGLEEWQSSSFGGSSKGIINYDFLEIDEDIFGRAYERYLAEVRKEEGIYYTRKYITKYLVNKTVEKKFDSKLNEIKEALNNNDFEDAAQKLDDFKKISVVDIACGSGSFLIKAIRVIWRKYRDLIKFISDLIEESQKLEEGSLKQPDHEIVNKLHSFRENIENESKINLISKIVLRHIFGNDLDERAIDVAKINVWLEMIKNVSDEFKYKKLPPEGKVLPDLEMNLSSGDSLVNLPTNETIEILNDNFAEEISKLNELRNEYLSDPTDKEIINEIIKIRDGIKKNLDEEFYQEINNDVEDRIKEDKPPLHWPLFFWFVYNDDDTLNKESGFDIVIGNPPYYNETRKHNEDFQIYKNSPSISQYYEPKMDVFYFFIEKSLDLLKEKGLLGYIILEYWKSRTYASNLNKKMVHESRIIDLINFHEFKVFEESAEGIHNDTIVIKKTDKSDEPIENYDIQVKEITDDNLSHEDVRKSLFGGGVIEGIKETKKTVSYNKSRKMVQIKEPKLQKIINKIESESDFKIPQENISVGVNTYPDKVTSSIIDDLDDEGIDPDLEPGEGVFVLSEEELSNMELNKREKELIKPYYRAESIDPFYMDKRNKEHLIYTENKLIDYDGNDIYFKAKEIYEENEGKKFSNLEDEEQKRYKSKAKNLFLEEIRKKYPHITTHLDKYLEREYIITSDRKPYGIHRSRSIDFFESKGKIISVRKTFYPKFVRVDSPCFMDESVNFIKHLDEPDDIVSILNSSVMHFWFRYGFEKKHGDQLQLDKEVLVDAPLKSGLSINERVDMENLRLYHKLEKKLKDIWNEAKEIKQTSYSLEYILNEDLRHLQKDEPEKKWTEEVKFYPEKEDTSLEEEYPSFKFKGDIDDLLIEIYGVNEKEEEIYNMYFKNKDLMLLTYYAIDDLFKSEKRINCLKDILSNTKIPVVKSDIEKKSPNIIRNFERIYGDWLESSEMDIEASIELPKITKEIQEKQEQINALVFDHYNLNEKEIEVILDSLEI